MHARPRLRLLSIAALLLLGVAWWLGTPNTDVFAQPNDDDDDRRLFTLSLLNEPVTDALRQFAQYTGMQIICGVELDDSATVTVAVEEVEPYLALLAILEQGGYEAMVVNDQGVVSEMEGPEDIEGNILVIKPRDERVPVLTVRIWDIPHESASVDGAYQRSIDLEQLFEQVEALLQGSSHSRAIVSYGVGTIYVEAVQSRVDLVGQYIDAVVERLEMEGGNFPGWVRGSQQQAQEGMPGEESATPGVGADGFGGGIWGRRGGPFQPETEEEEDEEEIVVFRDLYRLPLPISRMREGINRILLGSDAEFKIINDNQRLILLDAREDFHEALQAYIDAVLDSGGEDVIREAQDTMETRVFTMQQPAQQTATSLEPFLSEFGIIIVDTEQNSLVIRELVPQFREIERFIQSLDADPQQVLIESTFLELKLDSATAFGLNALWNDGVGSADLTYMSNPPAGEGFEFGFNEGNAWQVTLEALQTDIDTNILSRPKFVVANNRSGHIVVGQEIPYLESTDTGAGGSGTASVGFKDVSLNMTATPHIEPGGWIRLRLVIEIRERIADTTIGGEPQPILSSRRASTEVRIRDGETLIIGGLIEDKETNTISQVPILGDIPLIGTLFRNTSLNHAKTDLLFFITPTILRDQEEGSGFTYQGRDFNPFPPDGIQVPDWFHDTLQRRLTPGR